MDDTKTLGDELPKEIARCRELLENYKAIGPNGAFGYFAINAVIKRAEQATATGDVVEMLRVYNTLKECK